MNSVVKVARGAAATLPEGVVIMGSRDKPRNDGFGKIGEKVLYNTKYFIHGSVIDFTGLHR
jgi:hypothetical protein